MSKAKIIIVEDEPLIADDLAATLENHGFEIVAIADEAKDALRAIEKYEPDLALLDINIEGDQDGIELAGKLNIPFIYLTSYYDEQTLTRAKKTEPAAYLVKPYNENDLFTNVEMALAKAQSKKAPSSDLPEKLFVRKDQEIHSIESSDIIYVEAFDNYANLYTEKDKYIISHTLKSIEEKLRPHGFVRIHRSYLINFALIDSISEGFVYLKGHKLMIGKSYRKDFLDQLSFL